MDLYLLKKKYLKTSFKENRFIYQGLIDTLKDAWDIGAGTVGFGADVVRFIKNAPKNIKRIAGTAWEYIKYGWDSGKFQLTKESPPNWNLNVYKKTWKIFEWAKVPKVNPEENKRLTPGQARTFFDNEISLKVAKSYTHLKTLELHSACFEEFLKPAVGQYALIDEKLKEIRRTNIRNKSRRAELEEILIPQAQARVSGDEDGNYDPDYLMGSEDKETEQKSLVDLQLELAEIKYDVSTKVQWDKLEYKKLTLPPYIEQPEPRLYVDSSKQEEIDLKDAQLKLGTYLAKYKPEYELYTSEAEKISYYIALEMKRVPPADKPLLEEYTRNVDQEAGKVVFSF